MTFIVRWTMFKRVGGTMNNVDWPFIFQIALNLVLSFAGAYGTAILSGATGKMAIASGLVALSANGAGLAQLRNRGNNAKTT